MRASALARLAGAACVATACLGACHDEPPPAAEAKPEAPVEKKPAVDDKIASVMAAQEAQAEGHAQGPTSQAAPPPDGILDAAAAARELPEGSAAQLVLGGEGSTPRLRLGPVRIAPGAGPTGKLQVSYRAGGAMMPTIQFELKPKAGPAGAETQPANLPASGGDVLLRFTLTGARPADNQPGRLPDNARAEIAKLDGSSIELTVQPSGALVSQQQKLAGNNPDLQPLITGSTEALTAALLPFPEQPVGAGAYWMIKSRETANGSAVLAYRMVKLTELTPSQAKLTVNTRRYLLQPTLNMAGLPPHHVRRFESEGEASLTIHPGNPYPDSAETRDGFMALVTPDDRPNQAVPIQAELSAKLSFAR